MTLFAAASLRDVLQELAPALEQAIGGTLVQNLGSSGDLARQILAGGGADVFLSADEVEMDRLAGVGLIAADTRHDLLGNRLVVIEPAPPLPGEKPRFAEPFDPVELAAPGVTRLSLASVASVPAGRYAKAWLERRGLWSKVEGRILPGVDVRAALAAVESGGAEAGIVYATDAARSKRVRVVFEVPANEAPGIVYPCALLRSTRVPERAQALLGFLRGPEARAAFERHGFTVL